MSLKTLHIRILGSVQSVFFRSEAKKKAMELGISGWIQNNSDGTVEVEVCGDNDSVDVFFSWCHEGSSSASVEQVEVLSNSGSCPNDTFSIRI